MTSVTQISELQEIMIGVHDTWCGHLARVCWFGACVGIVEQEGPSLVQ